MFRSSWSLPLLHRLFLLVGFALLPAVLLLVAAVAALRAQHAAAVHDQARRIAEDGAARLERLIEGTRQSLLVLSEANSVRSQNYRSCGMRLHALGQRLPEQIRISVLDREGWVLCDTAETSPYTEFGGDRDFHRLALAADGFVVGGFEFGAAGPEGRVRGALHMALPVRPVPEEPPVGVVAAALGMGWIAGQLRPVGLPPGAELFLLDRGGKVVLRVRSHSVAGDGDAPPDMGATLSEVLAGLVASRPADPAAVPAGSAARAGGAPERERAILRDAPGADGTPRLYALAPEVASGKGALHLVVSLDAAGALAPVGAVGRRWALLVAFGLAASLVAAWFGARRFVLAPLRALQRTAGRWAEGEYTARAAPSLVAPPPEFARLAVALDRVAEAAEQRDRAAVALAEKEARLSLALEAGGLGAWEVDPRRGDVQRTPRHDALFGYPRPEVQWSYRKMLRHVLPADRARVEAVFRRNRAGAAPLRVEFRIRRVSDGEVRWLEATGAPHHGPDGRMKYLGVLGDVTERRRAEERLRLVAGELNHRVKNTLAAVQSIAAQTLRWPAGDAPAAEAARASFEARLLALARSHDLLTREGWSGADLAEVAACALAPHAAQLGRDAAQARRGAAVSRVTIAGPPVRLSPRSAIPLAMALHELATNAARHGALSVPEGRVAVSWTTRPPASHVADAAAAPPRLVLCWQESGGPTLAGPPARRGFGTRLLERGLAMELRGAVRLDFAHGGLRCEIEAPLAAVPAAPGDEMMALPLASPPLQPARAVPERPPRAMIGAVEPAAAAVTSV